MRVFVIPCCCAVLAAPLTVTASWAQPAPVMPVVVSHVEAQTPHDVSARKAPVIIVPLTVSVDASGDVQSAEVFESATTPFDAATVTRWHFRLEIYNGKPVQPRILSGFTCEPAEVASRSPSPSVPSTGPSPSSKPAQIPAFPASSPAAFHALATSNEVYPREMQFRTHRAGIGQMTVHANHALRDSFGGDSALRFDQIAAQYVRLANPVATLGELEDLDFTAFIDKTGKALPMRARVNASLYTPSYPTGQQLHFDALKVPVDKTGDPAKNIRGDDDYIGYSQATQEHSTCRRSTALPARIPRPKAVPERAAVKNGSTL